MKINGHEVVVVRRSQVTLELDPPPPHGALVTEATAYLVTAHSITAADREGNEGDGASLDLSVGKYQG